MSTMEQCFIPVTDPCVANAGLFLEAEKELAAFLSAVTQIHGAKYVSAAAKHWIQSLDKVYVPSLVSKECFRKVTIETAAAIDQWEAVKVFNRPRPASEISIEKKAPN
jgi:hypothetical protein